jgi:hypothetical protein
MIENDVWDELRRQTERLEKLHRKLEAIKSHISFPNLSTYGLDLRKFTRVYINVKDFHSFIGDLEKILGSSEFKEKCE